MKTEKWYITYFARRDSQVLCLKEAIDFPEGYETRVLGRDRGDRNPIMGVVGSSVSFFAINSGPVVLPLTVSGNDSCSRRLGFEDATLVFDREHPIKMTAPDRKEFLRRASAYECGAA